MPLAPGRLDLCGSKGNHRPMAGAGSSGLSVHLLPLGGAVCPGCGSRVRSLSNLLCPEPVDSGFCPAGSLLCQA